MELEGEVFTGLGEGADYIGMKPYQEKLKDITGYYPFEGTLNLKVSEEKLRKLKETHEPEVIETFEYQGDEFSRVEVYAVEVEGVRAAYLDIEVTDHGEDVMEIIAAEYLRGELDLEDGDTVQVTTK